MIDVWCTSGEDLDMRVNSKTDTDQYKLVMAEAGFRLRTETFYLSFRRGGPHKVGLDLVKFVEELLAGVPYPNKECQIEAVPRGSWVFDNEPFLMITGPSQVVSYLESEVLRVHYQIQIATMLSLNPGQKFEVPTTCTEHADLLEPYGVRALSPNKAYLKVLQERFKSLVTLLGDPSRIFEVGMRGSICREHHLNVLEALKDVGLQATSSILGAELLDLKAVGTMGHEHIMRFDGDVAAFEAMIDRVEGPVSFLVDTNDAYRIGIPAAIEVFRQRPGRLGSLRFDSDNLAAQFAFACALADGAGIKPNFIFEDGLDVEKTATIEEMRKTLRVAPERVSYGYGGFLVNPFWLQHIRDLVQAIYKVSRTGGRPVWKKTPNKQSIAGKFTVFSPSLTSAVKPSYTGIAIQDGEEVPEGLKSTFSEDSFRDCFHMTRQEVLDAYSKQRLMLSEGTIAARKLTL